MADQRTPHAVETVRAARRRVSAIGRALDGLALFAVLVLLACGGWLARETLAPAADAANAGERTRAVQTLAALLGPDGLIADLRATAIDPAGARDRFERRLATARRAVAVLRSGGVGTADPSLDAIETTLARAELAARSGAATLDTGRAVAALRALDDAVQPASGGTAAITPPPLHVIATVLAASLAAATLGLSVAWRRLALAPGAGHTTSSPTAPQPGAAWPASRQDADFPGDAFGDGRFGAPRDDVAPAPRPPGGHERAETSDRAPVDRSPAAAVPVQLEPRGAILDPARPVDPPTDGPHRPARIPPTPAPEVVPPPRPAAQPIGAADDAAAVPAGAAVAGATATPPPGDVARTAMPAPPVARFFGPVERRVGPSAEAGSRVASRRRHANPWSRPADGAARIAATATETEPATASSAERRAVIYAARVVSIEPDRGSASPTAAPVPPAASADDRREPDARHAAPAVVESADPVIAPERPGAGPGIADSSALDPDQADLGRPDPSAAALAGGAGDDARSAAPDQVPPSVPEPTAAAHLDGAGDDEETVTADRVPPVAAAPSALAFPEGAGDDEETVTAAQVPPVAPGSAAAARPDGAGDHAGGETPDRALPAVPEPTAAARPDGPGDEAGSVAPDRGRPTAPEPTEARPVIAADPASASDREPGAPPNVATAAKARPDERVQLAASLVRRTASTADPATRAELAGLIETLLRRIVPPVAPATEPIVRSPPSADQP